MAMRERRKDHFRTCGKRGGDEEKGRKLPTWIKSVGEKEKGKKEKEGREKENRGEKKKGRNGKRERGKERISRCSDGQISMVQESKLVYAAEATRGYQNQCFIKLQEVGVSPTLIIPCLRTIQWS